MAEGGKHKTIPKRVDRYEAPGCVSAPMPVAELAERSPYRFAPQTNTSLAVEDLLHKKRQLLILASVVPVCEFNILVSQIQRREQLR